MRVAVVGIGRVGLPFAVVCSRAYRTIGVDTDQALVDRVNHREHFSEPRIDEYLRKYRLKATTDVSAVRDCNLVIVCVGSQVPGEGYSTKRPLAALRALVPYLTSARQTLLVMSTLPPTGISEVLDLLRSTGVTTRIAGVVYSPTMIALGNAVMDFERPQYLLVGGTELPATRQVVRFWRGLVGRQVPILESSLRNVAVTKYALNVALVLKISMMNLVAEYCETFGGDVDVVASAFKLDARIAGPQMFKGGLGYGGTCFPVDMEAILGESKAAGLESSFFSEAIQQLNAWQVLRTVRLIESYQRKRVSVLGLTYKPNTAITVASQALEIAQRLQGDGLQVTVYDPEGMDGARKELDSGVTFAASAREAVASSDVILIAVEWPQFSRLTPRDFRPDQILIDPWRLFRGRQLPCSVRSFGLGGENGGHA